MRTSTIVLLVLLVVFLFAGVGLLGIGFLYFVITKGQRNAVAAKAAPAVVTATDGRCRLSMPSGWSLRPQLENNEASIKVANVRQEAYLIVITDAKADFADDMTYRKLSDLTRGRLIKKLDQAKVIAGPKELVINGRQAVQYEVHGVLKSSRLKLAYLHTMVDGEKSFHQIVAWTLRSRIEANRQTMEEATTGLTDVP